MVWTSLIFSSGDILPAVQMNQLQNNFGAMAGQDSGSPKIDVSCAAADLFEAQTIIASDARFGVGSFGTLHATSANIDNLQADIFTVSGFQADVFSANILTVGSAHADFLSASDFYANAGSFNILNIGSANIESLISSDFRAGVASVGALHVGSAMIDNLDLDTLVLSSLQVDAASFNILTTSELLVGVGSFGTFHADSAAMDNMEFNAAIGSDFRAGVASVGLLNVGSGHLNFLTVSDFYGNVGSFNILNVVSANITALYVFNLANFIMNASTIYTRNIYVDSIALGVTKSRYDNSSAFATTAYADDIRQVDVGVKTSSYTSTLNDNVIQFDNGTNDLTYTLSQNSAVAYPTGKIIEVRKTGAGDITIDKNGMTFAGVLSDSNIKLDGQHGYSVFLEVTSVNNWLYQGNLKTV